MTDAHGATGTVQITADGVVPVRNTGDSEGLSIVMVGDFGGGAITLGFEGVSGFQAYFDAAATFTIDGETLLESGADVDVQASMTGSTNPDVTIYARRLR